MKKTSTFLLFGFMAVLLFDLGVQKTSLVFLNEPRTEIVEPGPFTGPPADIQRL